MGEYKGLNENPEIVGGMGPKPRSFVGILKQARFFRVSAIRFSSVDA